MLMLDIETLDTIPSAVVFQVAVVVFNEEDILEKCLFHLDILPQIMRGRTINSETQKWWMTQKPESWFRTTRQVVEPIAMFREINNLVQRYKITDVWSNSPSFDSVIIQSLERDFLFPEDRKFPNFRSEMDMRTLKKLVKKWNLCEFPKRETSHNALSDCLEQIEDLRLIMKSFTGRLGV